MYWQINIERVVVFSCKKSLTQRFKIVEYFFDIRHDPQSGRLWNGNYIGQL